MIHPDSRFRFAEKICTDSMAQLYARELQDRQDGNEDGAERQRLLRIDMLHNRLNARPADDPANIPQRKPSPLDIDHLRSDTETPRKELDTRWNNDVRPSALAGVRPSSTPSTILLVGCGGTESRIMRHALRAKYPLQGVAWIDEAFLSVFHPDFLSSLCNDPLASPSYREDVDEWVSRTLGRAVERRLNVMMPVEPKDLADRIKAERAFGRRVILAVRAIGGRSARISFADWVLESMGSGFLEPWPALKAVGAPEEDAETAFGLGDSGDCSFAVMSEDGSGILYWGSDGREAMTVWREHAAASDVLWGGRLDAVRDAVRGCASVLPVVGAESLADWFC